MPSVSLDSVNAMAELEHYGMKFEFAGGDELRIACPFHADGKEKNPSCHLNNKTKEFYCQTAGCGARGNIVKLLAMFKSVSQNVVLADFAQRYEIDDTKIIDPMVVERYHQEIWAATPLLAELYKRGLREDDVRRYRLGYDDGRITIPIYIATGAFVNIRRYLPGAPGKQKMRNTRGYSKARWYPIEQLKFDTLVFTGGECKSIVGARELNKHNIGCITSTHGENNIDNDLLNELRGKKVYICMDVDKPGKDAARKHANRIRMVAAFTAIMDLPLDPDLYPKGDINDYVANGGDLFEVVQTTAEYKAVNNTATEIDNTPPRPMPLAEAVHADNAGVRVEVKVFVSKLAESPYIIPRDVEINCPKGEKGFCGICPVFMSSKELFTIPNESPSILQFIDAGDSGKMDAVKHAIGIPSCCNFCDFVATSSYNAEDTRISPHVELTNRDADRAQIQAVCIGDGLTPGQSYVMTGKLLAHPRSQKAVFLMSNYVPAKDSLAEYTVEHAEQLAWFYPTAHTLEAVGAKFAEIHDDLAANVTKIYRRPALHTVCDLAYHSALNFEFDGTLINGWVEALVIGDTGVGKSWVTDGLRKHYQLGEVISGKNATTAGLIGGLEKMGDSWVVAWGAIPNNDQQLGIVEEVKGMLVETIGKLTDTRSNGYVELVKIGNIYRARCRMRSIWVSNPRKLKINQLAHGMLAVKDLIGEDEDIRRFDLFGIISKTDVDQSVIHLHAEDRPKFSHRYTSELCRDLILWTWTRSAKQINFTPEAVTECLAAATAMCLMFDDTVPIVDRGTMRHKLAKLSVACAARMFSHAVDDYETLVVHPCHVQFVAKFLIESYSATTFGYLEFTAAQKIMSSLLDQDQIRSAIEQTVYPRTLCNNLLARDFIEKQDLSDWTTLEMIGVTDLLSVLVRKQALMRRGKAYCKTPLFITFLKNLLLDPTLAQDITPLSKGNY